MCHVILMCRWFGNRFFTISFSRGGFAVVDVTAWVQSVRFSGSYPITDSILVQRQTSLLASATQTPDLIGYCNQLRFVQLQQKKRTMVILQTEIWLDKSSTTIQRICHDVNRTDHHNWKLSFSKYCWASREKLAGSDSPPQIECYIGHVLCYAF